MRLIQYRSNTEERDHAALHGRHRQWAARRYRGQRMWRHLQHSCAEPRAGRPEEAGISEDQPDRPHPDANRSGRSGRETADALPVLGDPNLSRREDRQIAGAQPARAGAHVPMGCGRRQRHGADRAEHLFPRQPHAREGAGLGDQVLRGAARHAVSRRRSATRALALFDGQ